MQTTALRQKNVTILDLADKMLDKGVVLTGDVTISVAEIDLVYLGLRALLSSVETMETRGLSAPICSHTARAPQALSGACPVLAPDPPSALSRERPSTSDDDPPADPMAVEPVAEPLSRHIDVNPQAVESGLAKLVLTLIELLRRLLERQALKRVEGGSLTDEETERIGETFMNLEKRMHEVAAVFGLKLEELNLDLGPLGDLM